MRPGDEPTEPPEWWHGEEDTEEMELTTMSESEWRRCTPPAPRNQYAADLVAFAASGDACWGREYESSNEAAREATRYHNAHRRNKDDLEGVRVVQRGRRVFLVRDGGAE